MKAITTAVILAAVVGAVGGAVFFFADPQTREGFATAPLWKALLVGAVLGLVIGAAILMRRRR